MTKNNFDCFLRHGVDQCICEFIRVPRDFVGQAHHGQPILSINRGLRGLGHTASRRPSTYWLGRMAFSPNGVVNREHRLRLTACRYTHSAEQQHRLRVALYWPLYSCYRWNNEWLHDNNIVLSSFVLFYSSCERDGVQCTATYWHKTIYGFSSTRLLLKLRRFRLVVH